MAPIGPKNKVMLHRTISGRKVLEFWRNKFALQRGKLGRFNQMPESGTA